MPSTLDLIKFWPRQLSDHCLFLQLGLVPRELKDEAADLRAGWEKFRSAIPASAGPAQVGDLSARALALSADLRGFKTRVHDRLAAGEWLGWLFPTFVSHIRRELDWFVDSLTGAAAARRSEDVLCTWLRFMQEHASFAAHLLDPKERALGRRAGEIADEFDALHAECSRVERDMAELSQRAGRELDAYFTSGGIGTPRTLSVVHPLLALHVVREGRMFLNVLSEMRGEKPMAEIPE